MAQVVIVLLSFLRRSFLIALGAALTAAGAGSFVSSAASRPLSRPRRQVVMAVLHLGPIHRSASVSRRFLYADVGIDSLRLTVPRNLHVELLIQNPTESATGQAPSKMLCVPFRLCHDPGRTALRFCHNAGQHTICAYTNDAGAIFQAGRFVVTVRELEPRSARISLRIVFVRGPGG
jgi:hypothetical protein